MRKYLFILFLALGSLVVLGFKYFEAKRDEVVAAGRVSYIENPEFSNLMEDLMSFASNKLKVDSTGVPLPSISVISEDDFSLYFRRSYKSGAKFTYHQFSEEIITYYPVLEPSYVIKSFLVHELVHHIQHYRVDMQSLDCIALAEIDAYKVMREYARLRTSKHDDLINEWIDKHKTCNGSEYNPYRIYPSLNAKYLKYLSGS